MANYSLFSSFINGALRQVDLSANTLVVQAIQINGTLLSSSASGAAGSKLIGDDNSYSNFTPSAATVKGALAGIDAKIGTLSSASPLDGTFRIENTADPTKKIAFDASAIATGTTATIIMSANNVDLAFLATTDLSNLAGSTSINSDLMPNADNSKSLGGASAGWKDLFVHSVRNASDTQSAIDIDNRLLIDSAGLTSLAFDARELYKSDGSTKVADWGSGLRLGGAVKFFNSFSSSFGVSLIASASQAADITFTLPLTDGSAGQVLKTDGSGQLSFVDALTTSLASAHIFVGSAGGVATSVAMSGEASIVASGAVTLSNSAVIGKLLTGYAASAGSVSSSDSILSAIEKIDGNDALKLPLAGGTMSGNIAMGGNKLTGLGAGSTAGDSVRYEQAILASGVNAFSADQSMGSHKLTNVANGTLTNDAVNYGQLSSLVGGLTYVAAIAVPNVLDDTQTSPPGSPVNGDAYLAGSGSSGGWTDGHLYEWNSDSSSWVDVLGRAVIAGDRLGIAFEHGSGAGGFAAKTGNIAEITTATPGSYAYTFTAPSNGLGVYISGESAQDIAHLYYYNSGWIDLLGSATVRPKDGAALAYNGNILNVQYDGVTLDLTGNSLEVKPGGISNSHIASGAAIAFSKLASLATGSIIVGNAGVATAAALSGDATISSAGALSLATVNSDVGSFAIANITVNGKGLITAASAASTTGSGAVVLATGATLVTPTLGAASATSINKVAITAPATGSTLTIDDGVTLHVSANATVSGTNTGDQTITLTGDVTGSGTGSFAATVVKAPLMKRTLIAGEAFAANTSFLVRWAVSGETAGRVYKADQDASSTDKFYVVGIAQASSSVIAGGNIDVVTMGSQALGASDSAFSSGDIGKAVFLTASGAFSTTAPTTANYAVVRAGMVQDTTHIDMFPVVVGVN